MFSKFKKNHIKQQNGGEIKFVSFQPKVLAESREISKKLLEGNVVLVDFSQTKPALSIRMVDFISGMLLSIDGEYKKIAPKLFLLSTSKEDAVAVEAQLRAEGSKL